MNIYNNNKKMPPTVKALTIEAKKKKRSSPLFSTVLESK